MSPLGVDLWAASAAFVAGSAVAIRARMLRPHQAVWTHAPAPVWLGLSLLALALLMAAASIWFGGHATAREATVYTVLAGVSLVMLWNLNRHGRAASVARAKFDARVKAEVDAVWKGSGPAARYPWERP
jgi:hypothetical protein